MRVVAAQYHRPMQGRRVINSNTARFCRPILSETPRLPQNRRKKRRRGRRDDRTVREESRTTSGLGAALTLGSKSFHAVFAAEPAGLGRGRGAVREC